MPAKLLFDKKKIIVNRTHEKYHITYYIFRADEPVTSKEHMISLVGKQYITNGNRACFAGFGSMVGEYKAKFKCKPNYVLFAVNKELPSAAVRLTDKEILRWSELCKENKIMPESVDENFSKTGCFCIDFSGISTSLLYIYLSAARYVQEEPTYVRAILHMIDDLKMGFYTAIGVATHFCINNDGHHILPQEKAYSIFMKANDLNTGDNILNKFDLYYASKLAGFIAKKEHTLIKIKDSRAIGYNPFNLSRHLNEIKLDSDSFVVDRKDLRKKTLEKIIISGKIKTPLVRKRTVKAVK